MRFKPGFVSVVLPMHNVYPYIEKTLESVVNQTYSKIEVIVVDDKSTDQSRDVAERYAEEYGFIRIVETPPEKRGPSVARNTGLKKARGEYIVFLDGDDYWDRTFLEVCVNALNEFAVDFCASASVDVLPSGKKIIIPQRVQMPTIVDLLRRKVRLAQGMVLFRREFLLSNNIFYPVAFRGSEDLLFITKALLKGRCITINEPLFFHVRRSDSMTSSNVSLHINQLRIARLVKMEIEKSNIDENEKLNALDALFHFHLPLFLILSLNRVKQINGQKTAWKLLISTLLPFILKFRPNFDYYSLLGVVNLIDTFVPIKHILKRLV